MRNKPEENNLNSMFEKYLAPDNCAGLETIKVNRSIGECIPRNAHTNDLRMQRVHEPLIKGVTAFVLALDKLIVNLAAADEGKLAE